VRRSPVAAGVLVALAVGTKISYVLYAVALLWALRRVRGPLARLVLAGAITGLLLFGPFLPELIEPLRTASEYVAGQSVWSLARVPMRALMSDQMVSALLSVAVWVLMGAVVWRLAKVLPRRSGTSPSRDDAVRTAALLSIAWLLSAAYALPWYDVIAWAPLVLLPASGVDGVLLLRTVSVAIGYIPGIVVRPAGALGAITAALRGQIAPLVGLVLLVTVLFFGDRLRLPPPAEPRPRTSSRSQ